MKVLFICRGNSLNGVNPVIQRQGGSLIEKGIDVNYFLIKGKGLKGYFSSVKALRDHLKINSVDILHAHYALCGFVALFGKRKQKLILSFMGSDLLVESQLNKKEKLISSVFIKLSILIAKLFFSKIIVKSSEMAEAFGSSAKLVKIPNGVNLKIFTHKNKEKEQLASGFDPKKRNIIFVSDPGRAEKNFKLCKEAFDLLNQTQYKLHTVFNLDTEQLVSYYNAADVVLMTSFLEGSPNVIKEAMACGCPIVSTAVGDVTDLLENVDGCFITDYSPENIKNCIIKAADYRLKNEKTNGREKLIQLGLTSEEAATQLIKLYNSLLP